MHVQNHVYANIIRHTYVRDVCQLSNPVVIRVKGQKMASNDKKLCLLCSVSQEPYIIWLSFMVHMCKTIITAGVFFPFFRILIFWVVRGDKGQKWQKWQKTLSVVPYISGTIHHMSHLISQEPYIWSSFMVHMCKRIISPGFFYIFPNFNF